MRKVILLILFSQVALFAKIDALAIDVVVYRGDPSGDGGYAEVSWSINRGRLAFRKVEKQWLDTLRINLSFEKSGEIVDSATLTRIVVIPQGAMVTENYFIFDKFGSQLPPGEYVISLDVLDLGDGDSKKIAEKFTVRERTANLSMSDIALLSSVAPDSSNSIFTYKGLKMLPKPDRTYGSFFPVMLISAEVYLPEEAGSLLVSEYTIKDANGITERAFTPETTVIKQKEILILNGINVVGLQEGEYILSLFLKELKTGQSAIGKRNFKVLKQKEIIEKKITSQLGEDTEREFEYAEYLMTQSEISMFKSLKENGKREYLTRWWESKDPTPNTPDNEFRAEILDRWHYANEAFNERGGAEKSGWKSDRGRVFIKYGAPNNIEQNPFAMGSAPHEQWDYFNIQGGVVFVFADILGIGEYKLIHSTASGEIYDPNWGDKVTRQNDNIRLRDGQIDR